MKVGLETLMSCPDKGKSWGNIGLLSNQASVDKNFRPAWQIISEIFEGKLTTLFGPQHGFFGTLQDNMIETGHESHGPTGLPLYSLYSEVREPTEKMYQKLDTLIIDLQITGCRIYTWKSTIAGCLRSAKKYGKNIVILDRPNPVGGVFLEGKTLDLDAKSFVGQFSTPMRHGLSAGESALLFNEEIGASLEVVKLVDWDPKSLWKTSQRSWVMTSPNLPTVESVHVYPGMVIFEGTNLSEGRGTGLPFQLLGAPYISDSEGFVERVIELNGGMPEGLYLRATSFQPTFHKWANEICNGLQIHVLDPLKVSSFRLSLAILKASMEFGGDRFSWKEPPYEYDLETLPMKLILGSHDFEKHLGDSFSVQADFWSQGIESYISKVEKHILYPREFEILK